jgi:hypothetical protein
MAALPSHTAPEDGDQDTQDPADVRNVVLIGIDLEFVFP